MTTTTQPLQETKTIVADTITAPTMQLLHLSCSPHIRHSITVPHIMRNVIIALLPAALAATLLFQVQALTIIILSIVTSVVTEFLLCSFFKRPFSLNDYSAVVTGLILALTLPPLTPWWMTVSGAVVSIGLGKFLFGGLGQNFLNPALVGRAFLTLCFSHIMTTAWVDPTWGTISGIDTVSSATPLAFFKEQLYSGELNIEYLQNSILHLLIGNVGGSIGETSVVAIMLGGFWLWYRKIIQCAVPLFFIATFFILSWGFNGTGEYFTLKAMLVPVFQVCAGGLLFGAIFMANDTTTTPITPVGKIIFGIGCGAIAFAFRQFTIFNEGVCFAILIMNVLTPLIEMYTKPGAYGK